MRIRWKLLILLLMVALIPLLVLGELGRHLTMRLGEDLAVGTRTELAAAAEEELSQTIRDAAEVLRRQREVVELAVLAQAERIESALARERSSQSDDLIFFDHDFDQPEPTIPGLADSPYHDRIDPATGQVHPLRVSYTHPVIRLIPGDDPAARQADITALNRMTSLYQQLHTHYGDLFYWQFTALESGVHCSYPGKGDYPENYDPRLRPWYTMVTDADHPARHGRVHWSGPIIDLSTGRVTLTAAAAIYRPDGTFTGVTAIDVVLSMMIDGFDLPQRWAEEADVMIVAEPWHAETTDRSPVILVQREYDYPRSSWDQPVSLATLANDDAVGIQLMVEDMAKHEAGVRRIPHAGEETICAYGPLGAGSS